MNASQRWQQLDCGFADVNGDGLADRVDTDNVAYLGTGLAFGAAAVKLPGPMTIQQSGQPGICNAPHMGDPAPTTIQTAALRDLTGDGIPDYVQQNLNGTWQVSIGTGAGFAPAIPISGGFVLSETDEDCDSTMSNTWAGLYDIDGDGKPDPVFKNGGFLFFNQLAGGNTIRTPEAGRLVKIDNGYGASTAISYRSAKEDMTMS